MKTANHKFVIALGLGACLALPGLAMADGGRHDAYRGHDRTVHKRELRRDHDRREHRERREAREWRHFKRHERREAREWRHYKRHERREAREWRHYKRHHPRYRAPVDYYSYPAYRSGISLSGVYFAPNPYLVIDLH